MIRNLCKTLLLSWALTCGMAAAGEDNAAPQPEVTAVAAGDEIAITELVVKDAPAAEQALLALVEAAANKEGGNSLLQGKKLLRLSARGAAMSALEKNLSVNSAKYGKEIAKSVLLEARTVFLPVFTLSYNYTNTKTNDRPAMGMVKQPLIIAKNDIDLPGDSEIRAIRFMPFQAPRLVPGKIYASERDPNGAKLKDSFTATISQQLPWGPSLTISVTPAYQKHYSDSRKHAYNRNWTTSVSATFYTPLPGTKGFGPYSPGDVDIKFAKLQRDRSYYELQAMIETVLLQADDAYWNLVAAVKTLETVTASRKALEELAGKTAELVKAGRTTKYGLQQIESEVARVKGLEETAWNSLAVASNALVNLLNVEEDAFFVPMNYTDTIARKIAEPGDILPVALANRPDLKEADIDVKYAETLRKYMKNQSRPDLYYQVSATYNQSSDVYGYATIYKSLSHMLNEDNRSQTHTLGYTYPWANRAAKSRFRQAALGEEDAGLARQQSENQVAADITNALADLAGAEETLQIASERVDVADQAFNDAVTLRNAGKLDQESGQLAMREFEVVSKRRAVLDAQYALIAAQIDYRKAESALYAAQGILAREYAGLTAEAPVDQHRLRLMKTLKALEFF